MPPRLSQKKSKGGCVRCKARHVKCDEVRPGCGACLRHGVDCQYALQAVCTRAISHKSLNTLSPVSSPHPRQCLHDSDGSIEAEAPPRMDETLGESQAIDGASTHGHYVNKKRADAGD